MNTITTDDYITNQIIPHNLAYYQHMRSCYKTAYRILTHYTNGVLPTRESGSIVDLKLHIGTTGETKYTLTISSVNTKTSSSGEIDNKIFNEVQRYSLRLVANDIHIVKYGNVLCVEYGLDPDSSDEIPEYLAYDRIFGTWATDLPEDASLTQLQEANELAHTAHLALMGSIVNSRSGSVWTTPE